MIASVDPSIFLVALRDGNGLEAYTIGGLLQDQRKGGRSVVACRIEVYDRKGEIESCPYLAHGGDGT